MPNPKKLIPPVRREIYLPPELSAILETVYYDPMKQKAKKGAINDYINSLIRKDLRERNLLSS